MMPQATNDKGAMMARFAVLLTVVIVTGGCSRGETVRCSAGTAYLDAGSAGPLSVPDDLTVPDESDALTIPAPFPPAENEASVDCLEYSPAYSAVPQSDDEED